MVLILIILEYIYIVYNEGILYFKGGLNPYYTGIHLHLAVHLVGLSGRVLILIILEYIYILQHMLIPKILRVLILIILEYIYILQHMLIPKILRVLILIILEYIYIEGIGVGQAATKSLNPYYTGIHLHSCTAVLCD